jgi:methionine synthase II (cobalamin-independent)
LEGFGLSAVKYLKLQITGPFTFASAINNESGVALLHDKVSMQAVIKLLNLKALWQANRFKKFGKEMIMFIDEPYLGCFGSAYTPINRKDVIDSFAELALGLKPSCSMLGVHCCGNTDWSIFTESQDIDIISFDAFDYQDKFVLYADDIKKFLSRKGIICWGIVPTQDFTGEESVEILMRKIRQGMESLVKKGVDEELLKERFLISPSCGLGTFTPQKADKIFQLLLETSYFIRKNF